MAKVEYVGDNQRVIQPEGSSKIFLNRKDPYGFWYISFERGELPDSLKDAYTTIQMAAHAVDQYLLVSPARKRLAKNATE